MTRIEIRQDDLTRRNYHDMSMISHYQIRLPKQLLDEFLHAFHGQNARNHKNDPGRETEILLPMLC